MPLFDDEWSRGKCAFKAIQMMAFGIPVVISPVGANKELVQHGINGFFASDMNEWKEAILKLADSKTLRSKMGRLGRKTVSEKFSLESSAKLLQDTLIEACTKR